MPIKRILIIGQTPPPYHGVAIMKPVSITFDSSVGYYCAGMIELGKKADLMILECSTPDNMKLPGHLTPSECGKLAQKASCRKLCLTHFYPVCDLEDVRTKCSTKYNGELFLAEDLMEFNI